MFRTATHADWPDIEQLLTKSALPLDGARSAEFEVAAEGGNVVACAAIERYGRTALLRSVAVDPTHRSAGVGQNLVRRVIDRVRADGVESLWLLTTTAADWFPRFGFTRADRDEVPRALRASSELQGACPASAVVMRLDIR